MAISMIHSLTFQDGKAEEAMNFYVSIFPQSKVLEVRRWGEGAPVKEGLIMQARFELSGSQYMCSDSPPVHNWDFSPAVSSFVACESEEQLVMLFEELSNDGTVLMPIGNYGFSKSFAWVTDRYKVSWQLNVEGTPQHTG